MSIVLFVNRWLPSQRSEFRWPWIGDLAVDESQIVGTCAFKSPPRQNRVEIGHFTFPDYEGRGIATLMAGQLISIAEDANSGIEITAQTLPQVNASTTILRKLGFNQVGTTNDDEVGVVWEWIKSRIPNPS